MRQHSSSSVRKFLRLSLVTRALVVVVVWSTVVSTFLCVQAGREWDRNNINSRIDFSGAFYFFSLMEPFLHLMFNFDKEISQGVHKARHDAMRYNRIEVDPRLFPGMVPWTEEDNTSIFVEDVGNVSFFES